MSHLAGRLYRDFSVLHHPLGPFYKSKFLYVIFAWCDFIFVQAYDRVFVREGCNLYLPAISLHEYVILMTDRSIELACETAAYQVPI